MADTPYHQLISKPPAEQVHLRQPDALDRSQENGFTPSVISLTALPGNASSLCSEGQVSDTPSLIKALPSRPGILACVFFQQLLSGL